MKKEQFIKNLRYSLRKLKKDEREKYLAYYEEIISIRSKTEFRKKRRLRIRERQKNRRRNFAENAVKREFKIGWIGSVLIILTLLSELCPDI